MNWIPAAREVVATKSARVLDEQVLDPETASMLISVYENLREENRSKYASLPLLQAESLGRALCSWKS